MNSGEFISFEHERPEANKHVIVTNNLLAKDAHGEMSHIWLTSFIHYGDARPTTFSADMHIENLSHWKYA